MSVLLETTLGDIVIDLYIDTCAIASFNFQKQCHAKYYNGKKFHHIQRNFVAHCGPEKDMENISIFAYTKKTIHDINVSKNEIEYKLPSYIKEQKQYKKEYYPDEISATIRHTKIGLIGSDNKKHNENGSAFYITLHNKIPYLDGEHTLFGEIVEGLDILQHINTSFVDNEQRPYLDIIILHTRILYDPFEDFDDIIYPNTSPILNSINVLNSKRLENDGIKLDDIDINNTNTIETEEEMLQIHQKLVEKEAKIRTDILVALGDIPDADFVPHDNIVFICNLNPITQDDDLRIIFSRFGVVINCDIVRDKKTKKSFGYAFIEMETSKECEYAVRSMKNAIIDDRLVRVDYSHSAFNRYRDDWTRPNTTLSDLQYLHTSGATSGKYR